MTTSRPSAATAPELSSRGTSPVDRWLAPTVPPERLAAFRALVGGYCVAYFVFRSPVFIDLADRRPSRFDPVGVLWWLETPLPAGAVLTLFSLAIVGSVAVTLGWRHRVTAPVTALTVLALTTYRSSWGQLLHFENLMTLHLIVVALAPSADAWSLDARRRHRANSGENEQNGEHLTDSARYGWPLRLAALITVATYVIAGIAKLRYGGLGWLDGDTLRNHIAYAVTRLDVFGGRPPIAGELAVRAAWLLGPAALISVIVELTAPVMFANRRLRNAWVGAAVAMHLAIALTMSIVFGYQLFAIAFAPLFALDDAMHHARSAWARRRRE